MKIKQMGALALALSMVTLVGCGSEGNEPAKTEGQDSASAIVTEITEPVEITFWHAMNGGQEKALTDLTNKFTEANPNITVTLQNQSSYPELQQKLTATTASPKNLPTMTQAYADWMFLPAQDGLVLNLADYINHETIGFDNFEDILPGLRASVEVGDKILGIPFNKSTEVIWYNKDLFEELNLEVPTTFEELKEVSKTIYEEKGIAGAGFDSLCNYYTTALKNAGVDFTPDADPTSPESIEAANYYLEGVKEGYFRIAGTDKYLSGPFGSQTVGMYIGSTAGEAYVKEGAEGKFEPGVGAFPAQYSIQQGTDLYVFDSATAEQKTAAFEYLKFLTTTENQIDWAIATGYLPIRATAIASDEYKNSGSLLAPILEDATEHLYVNPSSVGTDAAYRESAVVMEGILAVPDTADVNAAMEAYKSTLSTIWE